MSGLLWLDWSVLTVSLFNTMVLLWLGLAILLNAERRTWGIWLAGGGMLMGSLFFLSHTAILGFGLDYLSHAADFWWRFGWLPVVLSPFAWYVVTLWYTGFWEGRDNPVRRRHRLWFWLLGLVCIAIIGLFIFVNPLPSFDDTARLQLDAKPSLQGVALLIVLYPPFIIACIGLALEALLRPGPTTRMMGQLARRRARPWLTAACLVLLLVSFLVGGFMWWVAARAPQPLSSPALGLQVAVADLLISTLIALAVVLIGQGVVSYEVFTGRTLPRRGLARFWRRALILAGGYSSVVCLSLALGLAPVYILLLSTCLLVVFYALLSWRSYAERESLVGDLRLFSAGPALYDRMLAAAPAAPTRAPSPDDLPGVQEPFCVLCEHVLGARLAYLAPYGAMVPLFGPPLACPPGAGAAQGVVPAFAGLASLAEQATPALLCLPVPAEAFAGAIWAVPLWNARGLCGVMLLGEKRDGGLYAQEDLETARLVGERLVDVQAGAELARRLTVLQRQRLVENQLADRRTRRILHDDVLPLLHAALLDLSNTSGAQPGSPEALQSLAQAHRQISALLRELPVDSAQEVARLGLVEALSQTLELELHNAFDAVDWQADPPTAQQAASLPPHLAEVVFYAAREALRNAARHARPPDSTAELRLRVAFHWQDGLEVLIEDNGVGIAGASPAEAGSGSGLALHSALLAVAGGSLAVESAQGIYTRVRINLPQAAIPPYAG